ncbi:calcium-binding protein [Methylopila henanensis]|uniref:Calcium-binding protein n=1 Tax=Methylopila henanensis TaxID=873516 RepID=A0ABW4KBK7_9HYPH
MASVSNPADHEAAEFQPVQRGTAARIAAEAAPEAQGEISAEYVLATIRDHVGGDIVATIYTQEELVAATAALADGQFVNLVRATTLLQPLTIGGDSVTFQSPYGANGLLVLADHVRSFALSGPSGLSVMGNGLNNVINGGNGSNTLSGLGGDDILRGLNGSDTLLGGERADRLDGGAGADRMEGGAGDDTYVVQEPGDRVIEADGEGFDTVYSSVSFSLVGQSIERLILTATGANRDDGTGNDLDNIIIGHVGTNVIDGGAGADRMEGRGGNDTYYVDNAGDVVIEADGGGVDSVYSSVSFSLAGQFIERLILTGSESINAFGNSQANAIAGNSAANVIDGRGGADRMQGGAGDDTYFVDDAGDVVIETQGAGFDTVNSSVSFSLAGQFIEKLALTGNAAINGTGNSQANTLVGNAAANTLNGLGGADRLDGGRGVDILTGGDGADTFVFSSVLGSGNVDRITDFVVADDTIELDRRVFSQIELGTLAAGAFTTGTAATEADDRIIYHAATGQLFFDKDGSGDAGAIHFATLSPNLATLSHLDFVVVG